MKRIRSAAWWFLKSAAGGVITYTVHLGLDNVNAYEAVVTLLSETF